MRALWDRLVQKRLVQYGVSGAAAFASEYGSFLLLFYVFRWSVVVSNTISFVISLIASFSLNKWWVFRGQASGQGGTGQVVRYALVATVNVAITDVLIHALVAAGVPGFIAKMVLIVVVAVSNFFVFKKIVFVAKAPAS